MDFRMTCHGFLGRPLLPQPKILSSLGKKLINLHHTVRYERPCETIKSPIIMDFSFKHVPQGRRLYIELHKFVPLYLIYISFIIYCYRCTQACCIDSWANIVGQGWLLLPFWPVQKQASIVDTLCGMNLISAKEMEEGWFPGSWDTLQRRSK